MLSGDTYLRMVLWYAQTLRLNPALSRPLKSSMEKESNIRDPKPRQTVMIVDDGVERKEWNAVLRDKLVILKMNLRQEETQAGEDMTRALHANADAQYWAASGKRAAYKHIIEIITAMLPDLS